MKGVRWGDGVYCPKCTSENVYRVKSGRPMSHRCRSCNRYFSVRVNSVFHETNIPLRKWLYAIYLLPYGADWAYRATQFSRQLGITQKSAWYMGHRIREGMIQSGEALSGEVEVDEMPMLAVSSARCTKTGARCSRKRTRSIQRKDHRDGHQERERPGESGRR